MFDQQYIEKLKLGNFEDQKSQSIERDMNNTMKRNREVKLSPRLTWSKESPAQKNIRRKNADS